MVAAKAQKLPWTFCRYVMSFAPPIVCPHSSLIQSVVELLFTFEPIGNFSAYYNLILKRSFRSASSAVARAGIGFGGMSGANVLTAKRNCLSFGPGFYLRYRGTITSMSLRNNELFGLLYLNHLTHLNGAIDSNSFASLISQKKDARIE